MKQERNDWIKALGAPHVADALGIQKRTLANRMVSDTLPPAWYLPLSQLAKQRRMKHPDPEWFARKGQRE